MPDRPRIPRLMLVTDASRSRLSLLELAAEAVAGGVDAIYLRDVHRRPEDLAGLVRTLRGTIGDDVVLLVNGGVEMALASGAGLHLREHDAIPSLPQPVSSRGTRDLGALSNSLPVSRDCLPPKPPSVEGGVSLALGVTPYARRPLIGRSVHSAPSASRSIGVDYVLAGHIFPSKSKPGRRPLGLEGLQAIVAAAPCPTLAIGGITPERVAEVVRAGAHGIAVIGAIAEADDPRAAASALREALDRALREEQEKPTMSEKTSVVNGEVGKVTFEIVVNGKTAAVSPGATVHDFLASKHMTDAMAIVERNGEIVPRGEYGATALTPGDRLEVVHAVGGG